MDPEHNQIYLQPEFSTHHVIPKSKHRIRAVTPVAAQKKIDISETSLFKEYERVKSLLKERQLNISKVKEENIVLKQIERRYQRELADLGTRNEEGPRIINGLRLEVQGLKTKLKESYAFQGSQDRRIRAQADQLNHVKADNARLQELTAQNDLYDRNQLQLQLTESNNRVVEQEEICKELRHKCELVEKNFSAESASLRLKLRAMENENFIFKDKIAGLEDQLRDRDKDLASLSIYKYNALHKKPEQCKICQKRRQEERELNRRTQILSCLPQLSKPQVTVASSHSVQVCIDLPPLSPQCQYDNVHLVYSKSGGLPKVLNLATVTPGSNVSMLVKGLITGEFYTFQAMSMFMDLTSEPSEHGTVLVDLLPTTPPCPLVTYQCTPVYASISIRMPIPASSRGETRAEVARLYQSHDGTSFYLLKEMTIVSDSVKELEHYIKSPNLAVPYWFCVSVVNKLGESERSAPSGPVTLDFPPAAPVVPQVKRFGATSVQVSIKSPKNRRGESAVTAYRVTYHSLDKCDHVSQVEFSTCQVSHAGCVVVNGIELGKVYVFAVSAKNSAGWSLMSNYSNQIDLEDLLPIPPSPQCIILSATSVQCLLYSCNDQLTCPNVVGYKLYISRTHDMSDMSVVSPFVPTLDNLPSEYLLDHLDTGANYWVAVSTLSANHESAISAPVCCCLASAIPLPVTPRAMTPNNQLNERPLTPPPTKLNKATSRSIDLSVAQRIQNLFKGNPDHIRMQAQVDGVHVIVTNGYMSPSFGSKHCMSLESVTSNKSNNSRTNSTTKLSGTSRFAHIPGLSSAGRQRMLHAPPVKKGGKKVPSRTDSANKS